MKYNLVIIDNDRAYGEALLNVLNEHYSDRFNVALFTDMTYLDDQYKKKMDIILIDADVFSEAKEIEYTNKIILLVDNSLSKNYGKYKYIFKYQSIDKIIKQIYNMLSDCMDTKLIINKNTTVGKIIGIFSPQGGCGKSLISITISNILALNKKTLYLSFEDYTSEIFFTNNSTFNLSDLLYYNMLDDEKFLLKLETIQCKDENTNIYYFMSPNSYKDIDQLKIEDLLKLMKRLQNYYDYIILDFSSVYKMFNSKLLTLCDKLFLIITDDLFGLIKYQKYIKELKHIENSEILNKMSIILNKVDKTCDEHIDIGDDKVVLSIPKDKDAIVLNNDHYSINPKSLYYNVVSSFVLEQIKRDDNFEL